jgi:CubicO group peptidase (beta-lactamase class C family)
MRCYLFWFPMNPVLLRRRHRWADNPEASPPRAWKPLVALGFCLALAASAPGKTAFPEKLDSLMRAYEKTQFFSGVVLVAKDDVVLYHRTFGMADREHKIANIPETRFNIASMGKTFTAVLVMQLVEQKKLDLHTPIGAYLPEYKIPNADKITIHHLLTHTSGLSNYMDNPRYEEQRAGLRTLDEVMALVTEMPLVFETPGKEFSYSNSGFIVLGRIIEKVTEMPYIDYAREKLWAPLGMKRTSIDYPPAINPPSEAVPYYVFSPGSYVNGLSDENPAFSDGGAFSCAPDLFAFARALMTGKLLKPETRALMLTPYSTMDPRTKYGYGWFVYENKDGKRLVGHSGGGHGYSADLKISLDDGYVIILLANIRTASRRITENIVKLIATGEYDVPQPSVETFLFEEMEKRGVAAVLDNLEGVLARHGDEALSSPIRLIGVADALASLKRYNDALRVHKRNIQLFPRSAMPYNAMAELYASLGKRDDAIGCFRKALAIDPKDDYASMRLKTLETARAK